jgi:AraC-like DNA-binding protein
MKLCHVEEHTSCFQYSAQDPTIEIFELRAKENIQTDSDSNQIVFAITGLFNITSKKFQNKKVKTGESILIPLHTPCVITAIEDVKMMVIKLNLSITFCDRLPLELLLETHGKIKKETDIGVLKPNQRLIDYVNMMQEYIKDGLKCEFFFDIKTREFLFLIRAYYDKNVVFDFFKPIYSTDFIFSGDVYRNLDRVKTVKEMAEILNYSLSGFEKKFKKVFNMSPYQWMQEQKAKKIYHEIHCSKKTFTEMAFEYDFSSPAHFNVFCKLFFGCTPGELRKENMERSASFSK